MILNINPNRMELMNLKNKLVIARRGHKLLKDKLDELVKVFMELIFELKKQRELTNNILKTTLKSYVITRSSSLPENLAAAYLIPWKKCNIIEESAHLVGIKVINFKIVLEEHPIYKNKFQFRFFNMSNEFERTLDAQTNLLLNMIKLAEIEIKANILGREIEKTRRRVNALEYIMIPNLLDTVRYIRNKIDETERGTLVRIMKIKDIVRANST